MADEQPTLPTLDAQAGLAAGREAVERDHFMHLVVARKNAAQIAPDCVAFLFKVVTDREEDTDRRIMAAAEILAFAKVP